MVVEPWSFTPGPHVKALSGCLLIPLVISLYSSPLPVVQDILISKSTKRYAYLPYILLWCNCFSWFIYCIHNGIAETYEPFTVNCYGLVVNTCALAVYYRYIPSENVDKLKGFRRQAIGLILPLMVLAGLSFVRQAHTCADQNSLWCWWGKLTVFVNILLFVGPFVAFKKVWRTKSVKYLPLLQSITGMIASFDAMVYFLALEDSNGLIPNVFGIFLSAAQVAFYFFITCRYPQDDQFDDPELARTPKMKVISGTDSPSWTMAELSLSQTNTHSGAASLLSDSDSGASGSWLPSPDASA